MSYYHFVLIFYLRLLLSFVDARVSLFSGDPTSSVKYVISTCQELRTALSADSLNVDIVLNRNLKCSDKDWKGPVRIAGNRVLHGMKQDLHTQSVHLDLSVVKKGILISNGLTLSLDSLVIHSSQETSAGDSILSFVLLSGKDATVQVVNSVIFTRSCKALPVSIFSLSLPHSQHNTSHSEEEENTVWKLSGEAGRMRFCQSQFYCQRRAEATPIFNLEEVDKEDNACSTDALSLKSSSEKNSDDHLSTRRRTITIILVAFFGIAGLAVAIVLWWRMSGLQRFSEKYQTKRKDSSSEDERSSKNPEDAPYMVKLAEITIDTTQELGTGGFGTVYEGSYRGGQAAVKIIRLDSSEELESNAEKECKISQRVSHPNVVETYACQQVPTQDIFGEFRARENEVCKLIVMEYCDKGELSRAIDQGEYVLSFASLQPCMSAILHSALDIAKGLKYLHSIGVVHGDLKPDNILRKSDELDPRGYTCKICDFGLSRRVGDILAETDTLGMISYMPPELIRNGYVGRFTDIYSFGMLLWEMTTSDVPFAEVDYNQIVLETINGRLPQIPDSTPSTVLNLIRTCWDFDFNKRPTATEVINQLESKLRVKYSPSKDGDVYAVAISEWYSAFPLHSITCPRQDKELLHRKSDISSTPISLLRSLERNQALDTENSDFVQGAKYKKRPILKACSYYEVYKQAQLASAPSLTFVEEIKPSTRPSNEHALVPPIFPNNSSKKNLSTTVKKESSLMHRSSSESTLKPATDDYKEIVVANKKSFRCNSTPRSTLAGFCRTTSDVKPPSISSFGVDQSFATYSCDLNSSQKSCSATSSYCSESRNHEEV